MSAERYTNPRALARMADGRCPECGWLPEVHGGWGGPSGCTLTDNGVVQRIYQAQQDRKQA